MTCPGAHQQGAGRRIGPYLQGPLGQLLTALRLPLDQGDVEDGRHVPVLHLQQPLDHTPPRHTGVPGGTPQRGACLVAPGLGLLTRLLLHLLAPQRHIHEQQGLTGKSESVPLDPQRCYASSAGPRPPAPSLIPTKEWGGAEGRRRRREAVEQRGRGLPVADRRQWEDYNVS